MAKPASGTALNTGHALYSGLTLALGMLEGGSASVTVDSKGSRHGTLKNTGGTLDQGVSWTTDANGDPAIAITSASLAPVALASSLTLSNSDSWSIAWRGKQTSADGHGILLGDPSNTADWLWYNNGSNFAFRNSGSSTFTFPGLTTFTTEADYLFLYDFPNDKFYLYKDAVEINAGGISAGGAGGLINITHLGAGYNDASLNLVGTFSYCYIWAARLLDATDAAALHSDPYAMFTAAAAKAPPIFRRPWRFVRGR